MKSKKKLLMRVLADDPGSVNRSRNHTDLSGTEKVIYEYSVAGLRKKYGTKIKAQVTKKTKSKDRIKFNCKCGYTWVNSIANVVASKYGCPQCAELERRKSLSAVGSIGIEEIKQKIEKRFNGDLKVLSKEYINKKSILKVKCNECGLKYSQSYSRLSFGYQLKHKEDCSLQNKIYEKLDEKYTLLFKQLHDLKFNTTQISSITGVKPEYVIAISKKDGWFISTGDKISKRASDRMLQHGAVIDKFEAYKLQARRLTEYIFKKYKSTFTNHDLRGKNFELDHIFSVHSGYTHEEGMISLKVLCHPANLKIITSLKNNAKRMNNGHTLEELKLKIKMYNKKYNKVVFPSHYNYCNDERLELPKGLTIMGMDPGSDNFGVFVGRFNGIDHLKSIEVLETRMIENPIKAITDDIQAQSELFLTELNLMIEKHKPQMIVIERYQSRGLKGLTIELVNYMIGLILARLSNGYFDYRPIIKLVMPATWKNKVNRSIDLKAMYKKYNNIESHRIDAMLQALFGFPVKDVYTAFESNSFTKNVMNTLIIPKIQKL